MSGMKINFSEVCRTCLGKSSAFKDINELTTNNVTLAEMVQYCTSVRVDNVDLFPSNMCKDCVKHVEISYDFKMRTEQTHAALTKYLQDQIGNFVDASVKVEEEVIIKQEPCDTHPAQLNPEEAMILEKSEIEEENCIAELAKFSGDFVEYGVKMTELDSTKMVVNMLVCPVCLINFSNTEYKCSQCGVPFHGENCYRYHVQNTHTGQNCPKPSGVIKEELFDEEEMRFGIPPEITEAAVESTTENPDEEEMHCGTPTQNLIPSKSKGKYATTYKSFMDWQSMQKKVSFSEDSLLVYFVEMSKKYKATSLWAFYSMLKSTLNIYHRVHLEKYSRLQAFLKRKSEGHRPKKAKTFTPEEMNRFIKEAPDDVFLLNKVALIMGLMGACRCNELHSMKIGDIEEYEGAAYVVNVPQAKASRRFNVTGEFYEICKKYIDLRPPNTETDSLFLNYQNGKCNFQKVGINKLASMGKQIAVFLKLEDPEMYTGHSFRRSSTNICISSEGALASPKFVVSEYSKNVWGDLIG